MTLPSALPSGGWGDGDMGKFETICRDKRVCSRPVWKSETRKSEYLREV